MFFTVFIYFFVNIIDWVVKITLHTSIIEADPTSKHKSSLWLILFTNITKKSICLSIKSFKTMLTWTIRVIFFILVKVFFRFIIVWRMDNRKEWVTIETKFFELFVFETFEQIHKS